MGVSSLASNIGKGMAAGLIGTLAITASQSIEMKLTGRQQSATPADAAGKVIGVQPVGEPEKQRFSQMVHFAYGTAWGMARGVIASLGLKGIPALLAEFAAVWGTELTMLPALKVSPPATQRELPEVAVDAVHHMVYAAAVNAAFEMLDRSDR